VPLISSFPSSTILAMSGIFAPLGLDPQPGYEVRFFDLELSKVRGGGPISYQRIDFPWHDIFDYQLHGLWRKARGYGWPMKYSPREAETAIEAFAASEANVFFAYFTLGDGAAHRRGPAGLEPVLRRLDEEIAALRKREPGRPFHVVLLSDHGVAGGEPLVNVRKDLKRAVRDGGYQLGSRRERPNDVVIVFYGLLSSFVIHADPREEERVSGLVVQVPGVDLCARRDQGGWVVRSADGVARIDRKPTGEADGSKEWRYRETDADPLDYASAVDQLRRTAGDSARDWFPDDQWLAVTGAMERPDALYRIARGFETVANPASIICSVAPGFMVGSAKTELSSRFTIGRLRWTHGSIHRDSTLGFITSDHPAWGATTFVRYDRALDDLLRIQDDSEARER